MKKIILGIALLSSLVSFSQFFEGKITYKLYMKSKKPSLPDELYAQMLGLGPNAGNEFYIKNGNFKTQYIDNPLADWDLFVNKDNKLYSKLKESNFVYWEHRVTKDDEIINTEIKKNVLIILGHQCDELTIVRKKNTTKYYYSSDLPVNDSLFLNYKEGAFYDFITRAKSISLKTIIEDKDFIAETIATEIKPMKLEDSFFDLPTKLKIYKSIEDVGDASRRQFR